MSREARYDNMQYARRIIANLCENMNSFDGVECKACNEYLRNHVNTLHVR